jgi:hypothetical protein
MDATGQHATATTFLTSNTPTLHPYTSFGAALEALVALERAQLGRAAGAAAAANASPLERHAGMYAERVQQIRAESNETTPAESPREPLASHAGGAQGTVILQYAGGGGRHSRATIRALGAMFKGPVSGKHPAHQPHRPAARKGAEADFQGAVDAMALQNKEDSAAGLQQAQGSGNADAVRNTVGPSDKKASEPTDVEAGEFKNGTRGVQIGGILPFDRAAP